MLSKLINQCRNSLAAAVSKVWPEESIGLSKKKWNKLAEENAMYYVVSKKGKGIQDGEFKETGVENYREHIESDSILNEKLGDFSEKRVLNIGSGVGRLEECLAPHFKEVYGIDISEVMIEKAKERLAQFSNVNVRATDGVTFPFENGLFDFIFSYIVFQHMPSKEVVKKNFEEIFRTLAPHGVAKIQIRGGHQPYKWQWFYGPVFNEKEAREMVESIGFKVLKAEGAHTKRFFLWLEKGKK